jgi:7-cyano-7-deazaguanine synthase
MNSVVVLLSGGIGSTVAAYRQRENTSLHLLYLNYGRLCAASERKAAAAVAERLDASLKVLDLPHVGQIAASRGPAVADAVTKAASKLGPPNEIDGLPAVLLAVGAQYAAAVGAGALVTGRCAEPGDPMQDVLSKERTVEPREFHHAFGMMLETALPAVRAVRLEAPLLDLHPFEVVQLGQHLGAPLELTWSCHQNEPACGSCPGCRSRAAAFAGAGMSDPILAV